MKRLRRALPVLAAIVVTWAITSASLGAAQSSIPNGVFVRNTEGLLWLVLDGQRVKIPVWPASDEEIAALPVPDRWAIMNDAGIMVAGDRPVWFGGQAAPPGSSSPPAVAPIAVATATQSTPAIPAGTVTLSGERGENTRPFDLLGGNYTVHWKTELRRDSATCFSGASLYRVEGKRYVESLYSVTLKRDGGDSTASGETQVYGLTSGAYFLDVNTTACSWSIEIRPQ